MQGKIEEAGQQFERALHISRASARTPVDVANSMIRLAHNCTRRGKTADAEALFLEVRWPAHPWDLPRFCCALRLTGEAGLCEHRLSCLTLVEASKVHHTWHAFDTDRLLMQYNIKSLTLLTFYYPTRYRDLQVLRK